MSENLRDRLTTRLQHYATPTDLDVIVQHCLIEVRDALAEKDERLRRANRRGEHLLARAEAEVARLRETVGRVEALAASMRLRLRVNGLQYGKSFALDFTDELDAALAPRESATEAPRTRDGEQGGER